MSELVFDSVSTSNVYPYACSRCRTRKLKCTKQAPCSNCLQKSSVCVYDNVRGSRGKKSTAEAPPERLQLSEPIPQSNQGPSVTPTSNEDDTALFTQHSDDAILRSGSGLLGDFSHCEQTDLGTSNVNPQNLPVQPQPLPITDSAMATIDWGLWWSGGSTDLGCDLRDLLSQEEATQRLGEDLDQGSLLLAVDEEILQKIISMYLDHIHPSRPFFRASLIQDGMMCKKFRFHREFASLVLAISAFTLLHSHHRELSTSNKSIPLATEMISEAIRLHNTSVLGEIPTLEALQTSIYIFAALWNLKQESTAWLRLHEAIGLFRLFCQSDLEGEGADTLGPADWEDRARAYLELVVLERAFAIGTSSRCKISLPPLSELLLQKLLDNPTSCDTRNASPHNSDYSILVLIGETVGFFDDTIVTCLRNDCGNKGRCTGLSREHILCLLERQREWECFEFKFHNGTVKLYLDVGTAAVPFDIFPSGHNECELLLVCLWLRNRLWHLALTHGHISSCDLETKLSFYYPIRIAGCSLVLLKSFRTGSLETSRDDLVQQCFDIAFDFLYAAAQIRTQLAIPDILDMKFPLPSVLGLSPLDSISPETMTSQTYYSKTATMSVSEIANGLLGFFASFNNGKHPRFKDYMNAYQDFMREA